MSPGRSRHDTARNRLSVVKRALAASSAGAFALAFVAVRAHHPSHARSTSGGTSPSASPTPLAPPAELTNALQDGSFQQGQIAGTQQAPIVQSATS